MENKLFFEVAELISNKKNVELNWCGIQGMGGRFGGFIIVCCICVYIYICMCVCCYVYTCMCVCVFM